MSRLNSVLSMILALCLMLSFSSTAIAVSETNTSEKASGMSGQSITPLIWDGTIATTYAGGDGTMSNPFQISSPHQLAKLANDSANGFYYVLTSDIYLNDISDQDWIDGSDVMSWTSIPDFAGTFDGCGYSIYGLYGGSLFGNATGTIKNICIKESYVNSGYKYYNSCYVGAIAGRAKDISGCSNSGSVSFYESSFTTAFVGGIAGYAENISQCSNSGNVWAGSNYSAAAGGIVGCSGITVSNCYNTGSVSSSSNYSSYGYNFSGGIIGSTDYNGTEINCCYDVGVSSSNGSYYRGGIVGLTRNSAVPKLTYCYSTYLLVGNPANSRDNGSYVSSSCSIVDENAMRQASSFAGFDFDSIWTIALDTNDGFPNLFWENEPSPTIDSQLTELQLREMYVNQHIAYFNSRFGSEVQKIQVPDKSQNYNVNELLGNIVLDAQESSTATNYSVARAFTSILNINFDFIDDSISTYNLLLADIVTSSYYMDTLNEITTTTMMDDICIVMDQLFSSGGDLIKEIAAEQGIEVYILENEFKTLHSLLERMTITNDPGEFAKLYGESTVILDKYVTAQRQKELLKKISKAGDVISYLSSAVLESASDVIKYFSCYDAYCTASRTFKQTLAVIDIYADYELDAAIDSFLINSTDEATRADAVANRIINDYFTNNIWEATYNLLYDALFELIPIARELHNIRKISGAVASGTMLLIDAGTKIDDIAYSANLINHLYYLANYTSSAAHRLGVCLETASDDSERFEMACLFDEAVRIWRCASIMLCDCGIQFEQLRLQEAQKIINRMFPLQYGPLTPIYNDIAIKQASWYSTAISIAAYEKTRIMDIHCHDVNLSYNISNRAIEIRNNAKIVFIACPVTIFVKDANNQLIATLSDSGVTSIGGYSPYFHVIETERGSGDYLKVCMIPKDWTVSFVGTDTGSMYAVSAEIINGVVGDCKVSEKTPVYEGFEGHITEIDDNISFVTVFVSGIWGNLNWQLDNEGQLTISGNGTMAGFDYNSQEAWLAHKDQIKKAVIRSGVTNISNYAFRNCSGLTSMIIPSSVISIGDWAFGDCSGLTNVTIGNGVTNIGHYAFYGCSGLTSVTIPDSVTSIGGNAFRNCSRLTSVTIPDSVTSIGGQSFYNCSGLTSITIGNSVTSIGHSAFCGCSGLTSVTIPKSVRSIDYGAFGGCNNLVSIIVDPKNLSYCDQNGLLFSKDKERIMCFPGGRTGSYDIPPGVTSIGDYAFYGCSGLTSVTIPDSVKSIGWGAFMHCSGLTSVTIPGCVTIIRWDTFSDCSGLTSVTIPDSVKSIEGWAFSGCGNLKNVLYSGTEEEWNTISIASYGSIYLTNAKIYYNMPAPDFILPAALTEIGEEAFSGGTFIFARLPEYTVSIGSRAFANCSNLTYIYIPALTTQIDEKAFGTMQSLTILGETGTTAETYAKNHHFTFIAVA